MARNVLSVNFFLLLACCLAYPSLSFGKGIGVIFSGNIPYYRAIHVAFLDELKAKTTGSDIEFITVFPAPDPVAWSNSAKKLVVKGVDMIISYGAPATDAALAKESAIPIVYVGLYEPGAVVRKGQVTGCGYRLSLASLLGHYQQVAKIGKLGLLFSLNDDDSVRQVDELAKLAEAQGITVLKLDLSSRKDLPKLDGLGAGDGVIITGTAVVQTMIKDIMASLSAKKIPTVDIFPDSIKEGALISFTPVPQLLGQKAAEVTAKIISGEQAERIEPVLLEDVDLVFNLSEAKKMGITIPDKLLAEAARVVE